MADYRAHFNVDELCAAIEMYHLGLVSEEELEQYWGRAEEKLQKRHPGVELKSPKNRPPKKTEFEDWSYFGYREGDASPEFGITFIAGFTGSGFPYGTTYEQLDDWAREDSMVSQDADEVDAWVASGAVVESNLNDAEFNLAQEDEQEFGDSVEFLR